MVSSNDVQRLFLQAVFSRRFLSGELARLLWAKCVDAVKAANDAIDIPHSDEQAAWDSFVQNVNTSLNDLDLEFRRLCDEVTGKDVYALVNRKDDEIAQMATDYTPNEISYFKAIVEQIMLAPNESYSLSSLSALREVNALKPKVNMSKTQAEVVLGSFVAKGWLLKSQRGRYSLSARTLLELQPYLRSTYPEELIECTICKDIITRGIACPTPNCRTRMHYHCFAAFRRRLNSCSACARDWPRDATESPLVPVGERAAKDGEDRKRHVRLRSAEASDQEELEDENELSQATQSLDNEEDGEDRPPKQSQAKGRKSRR